ncbi:cytochrome P450 [Halopiger aswanensis]|uniref:Cytochrome P450 n=1 Tax=Halopiger aswanensis TaxID=148449 RepID=A0A3R7D711_9EURY|nr:cytochrome P450 [Halopiger aswanensis]RKD87998.1 cytochrome P450 [Halopiger aswanensis]
MSQLPGPTGYPLIGNTHQFYRKNILKWFSAFPEKYGDIAQIRVARNQIVLLMDPNDIQTVLIDENKKYRKGGFHKRVTSSLIGNGLVLAEGDRWRSNRHDLEPSFHPQKMNSYANQIKTHTEYKLGQWEDGDIVMFGNEMKELTLRIITNALFDIDLRSENWDLPSIFDEVIDYFTYIAQTYVYLPEWIPTSRNRSYRRAIGELDEIVDEIITRHIEHPEEYDSLIADLLDQESWTKAEIRDEVVTLLLAGHETTALMLAYTTYLLGSNPDIRAQAINEIDQNEPQNSEKPFQQSNLLDHILKESLRLYPPAYAIFRQPTEDVILSGHKISEGTLLCLSQWVTHRDPRLYESPHEFQPDRWESDSLSAPSPGMYFPFAAGPRRCIGERLAMLEGKIVLGMILEKYIPKVPSQESLEVIPSLSTQPSSPIKIKLERRN